MKKIIDGFVPLLRRILVLCDWLRTLHLSVHVESASFNLELVRLRYTSVATLLAREKKQATASYDHLTLSGFLARPSLYCCTVCNVNA